MLKKIESNDSMTRYKYSGPLQYINAIRRILLSEIPCLAIDLVEISNSTSYPDELIVNKLCMLPVSSIDNEKINYRDKCSKCYGGCNDCTIHFTLEKTGPCRVMSKDLIPSNKNFTITNQRIPIIDLQEGQTLKVDAIAIKGIASTHSKWSAAHVGFSHSSELIVSDELKHDEKLKKEFLNLCPKGFVKSDLSLFKEYNNENLALTFREDDMAKFKKLVELKWDENTVFIMVESLGQYPSEILISLAIKILQEKFTNIANEIY